MATSYPGKSKQQRGKLVMVEVNDGVDSTEDHIKAAKAYLLKASSRSGQTMYVLYVINIMM